MQAKERVFNFLTMEGKVIVPFFQRTYVWTKENWEELLNDLLHTSTENVFLGSIILKQIPTKSGEPKKLEIIDGQQRITTLTILLKALYDSLPEESRRNCEPQVFSILKYRRDYTSPNYELRIEHSRVDKEAYEKVIEGKVSDLNQINDGSHLILQCYKYFF